MPPRWLAIYGLLATTSFLLSASLTWILIRVAPRLGLVDEPSGEKFHRVATPVGGGVAMYAALLPLLFVPAIASPTVVLLLLASGFLALVGLVDDLRHVSAVTKFGLLVGLTLVLSHYGLAATTTRIPAIDLLLTVLWITGVSSAFNAIDNMDGLATGVTAIAAIFFLLIALQTQQWVLGGLAAALLGSSLGFLVFNFHPARIFMGDSGSFPLGFFLAAMGVVGDWNSNEVIAAVIPVLILGLPIFDLAFTVLRRHQSGVTRTAIEAIRHCSTDHVSHRLVRLGLDTPRAVLFLYLIAASFGISAVTLRNAGPLEAALHLLQAGIVVAALIPLLCLAEPAPTTAGTTDLPRTAGLRAVAWLAAVALASTLLGAWLAGTRMALPPGR